MRGLTADELAALAVALGPSYDAAQWLAWEDAGVIAALWTRGLLGPVPCPADPCTTTEPHTGHSGVTAIAKLAIECHKLATRTTAV